MNPAGSSGLREGARAGGGRALVLGMGTSGLAAARLLRRERWAVTAVDSADGAPQAAAAAALKALGAEARIGWPADRLPRGKWALAVVSPGVPASSPWIAGLRRRGVPVVSELELGWSRRGVARTLAVTGSNGKSTLVKLLAECLAAAGRRAVIGGNYGPPACDVVPAERAVDWLVLEVSSFQLETCAAFRPDVGIILNVQPNHLDRHGAYAAYLAVKASLGARQTPADTLVLPEDQRAEVTAAGATRARVVTFGATSAAEYRFRAGRVEGPNATVSVRGGPFDNEVTGLAAAAAAAALAACGAGAAALGRVARRFEPLPHRFAPVAEIDGVVYIDDSKATSGAALAAALRRVDRPVRLIAGGRPKEREFSALRPLLAERVRGVYLIGEAADLLASAWRNVVPCAMCGTLETALALASQHARAGEAVLLSPACTSFDQYRGFEERGEAFAKWVQARAAGARGERKGKGASDEKAGGG